MVIKCKKCGYKYPSYWTSVDPENQLCEKCTTCRINDCDERPARKGLGFCRECHSKYTTPCDECPKLVIFPQPWKKLCTKCYYDKRNFKSFF